MCVESQFEPLDPDVRLNPYIWEEIKKNTL